MDITFDLKTNNEPMGASYKYSHSA